MPSPRPILVSGFEPFGGDAFNPSGAIAAQLNGSVVEGHRIFGVVLPCVFGEASGNLLEYCRSLDPGLVVCLGLANGRAAVTPERIAINVADARIPDNAGRQPIDEPIVPGGPAGYWSTLPVKAIVASLRQAELPAAVSETAGTFVCNHVFYSLMHFLAAQPERARGGFIHVPATPGAGTTSPTLPLEKSRLAIEIALATGVRVQTDLREAGGAVA